MAVAMQRMTKEEAMKKIASAYAPGVADLFATFPVEIQRDTTICNSCVQKCHYIWMIPELFHMFPEEIKKDTTICNSCIQECDEHDIPDLFDMFPEEIKKDTIICNNCIQKCKGSRSDFLFVQFPDELQKDPVFLASSLEKWKADCNAIPTIFANFSDESKKDGAVLSSCLKKCSDTKIPNLFRIFPEEIKTDLDICSTCIERCDFAVIDELKETLPDPPKSDKGIKIKLKAKEGKGGICQKYKILLTTIPRLLCGMGIFGGMVEGLVKLTEIFGDEKAFLVHWRKNADKKYVFEPLLFCKMPPPQPLWVAAIYNSMKTMILTLMFGYISRNLKEDQRQQKKSSRMKRLAFVVTALLQLTSLPITQALMIWSFFTDPSRPCGWKAFECFYLHLGSSFFDFTYWLLLVRSFGVREVLEASHLAWEYNEGASKAFLKPSVQIADLRDTLLGRDTTLLGEYEHGPSSNDTVALEYKKLTMIANATVICASAYVIMDLPFLVVYKIPAGIAFSPFLFILIRFMIASFRITWPFGWKAFVRYFKHEAEWKIVTRFLIGENPERSYELCTDSEVPSRTQAWEEAERTGFLVFFPILFGMAIINLILTYGSVYLYNGLGYFKSIVTVIAERKMSYYWDNFYNQVLGNYWAVSSLVNEVS